MKIIALNASPYIKEKLLVGKGVRTKFLTCGRPNCSCKLGRRHGPYYYVRTKLAKNKYADRYVTRTILSQTPFKYEVIGDSILFDVDVVDKIPKDLKEYPLFVVSERLEESKVTNDDNSSSA